MVNEAFQQAKGSVIASGIASILLGILFLGHPLLTGVSFCYFIGGLLVIAGIAKVIFCVTSAEGPASSIIGGVLLFLFGLLCFNRPDVIADIMTMMAGIYIIADGASTLNQGIYAVRSKMSGGVAVVIFAIILMIAGFYVLFAPFTFIMTVAGFVMILEGIFNLVFVGVISKKINEAKQA